MRTAATPETMRVMEMLGFEPQSTEDSGWAEFLGHGIAVTVPSDVKLTVTDGVRVIVEAAQTAGKVETQKALRKLLGIR